MSNYNYVIDSYEQNDSQWYATIICMRNDKPFAVCIVPSDPPIAPKPEEN